MLESLINATLERLKEMDTFTQLEPYEGQLDDTDQFMIVPPACFVEFSSARPDGVLGTSSHVEIEMYLVTNHIKGHLNIPMLNIVDQIKDLFNDKKLGGLGRCHYTGFVRMGILPGFISYRVSFLFKEDQK